MSTVINVQSVDGTREDLSFGDKVCKFCINTHKLYYGVL